MSKKTVNRGLGRGLNALIPGLAEENDELDISQIKEVELGKIVPNAGQPRKIFDNEGLKELAQSIQEHGLIQPLVVRPLKNGQYQIIVGERRWRACKHLGLRTVPVVVKDWDDQKTSEAALIENIQRRDLNPLEEAQAFRSLIEEYGITQENLAIKLGKSRTYITNSLRLLSLPNEVQGLLAENKITSGHAKAILGLESQAKQVAVALQVLADGLSVRKTEELVRLKNVPRGTSDQYDGLKKSNTSRGASNNNKSNNLEIQDFEERLKELLKTQVKVRSQGTSGKIEIEYYTEDDLHRIFELLFSE